jgi:uncharacterized membrane protein
VNDVIGAFEMKEENKARIDVVPFLMIPKSYHLLIMFFSLFIEFLLKSEYALDHLGEKHYIFEDFVIKCLDEVLT